MSLFFALETKKIVQFQFKYFSFWLSENTLAWAMSYLSHYFSYKNVKLQGSLQRFLGFQKK